MFEISATAETKVSLTSIAIIEEAKRIEENCLYSAKGHYVAAHFWSKFHLWIGVPSVILAAIAGTTAFVKHSTIAGIISICVTILTAISTFLDPKQRNSSHFAAANNYDTLQSSVRRFWSIECRSGASEDLLTHKLDDFSVERDRLNRESPQIPRWAFIIAKKNIANGEADYSVDNKQKIAS